MTRFGAEVHLAHPEGYEIMPEVEEVARQNAARSGGKFVKSHSMAEAFKDADIVYPKSWAPFAAMEKKNNPIIIIVNRSVFVFIISIFLSFL
jgi:ornithine carbamoyltransferase